jgi:hypothetical protein
MDVVTAYLYGSLDSDIYMKVLNGISVLNMHANRNIYCVKLAKSFYWFEAIGMNVVQPIERVTPKQRVV